MDQLTMKRQFRPLPRNTKNLIVSGGRPPYTITIVNKVGAHISNLREIENNMTVCAVFLSYDDACSVAEDLLRDLKMTLEEDEKMRELYPTLTISLDDL